MDPDHWNQINELRLALDELELPREGWLTRFTTRTAPGAMTPGTRIIKVKSETNDCHADGALGTVIGSLKDPRQPETFYFIEWDDTPRAPCGCMDWKITQLPQS